MRLPLIALALPGLLACDDAPAPSPAHPPTGPANPAPPPGQPPGPPQPSGSAGGPNAPDPEHPAVAPDAQGMLPIPGGWIQAGWQVTGPRPPGEPERPPAPPWRLGVGAGMPTKKTWVAPFRIDRTEVTRAAYREFLLATGYRPPSVEEEWFHQEDWSWTGTDFYPGTAEHPVVGVSWYDAGEYCAWKGKRLPTDAEWQLAALGPAADGRRYPWGQRYESRRLNHGKAGGDAFDDSDGYKTTAPVGSFPAGRSVYGAEDMFGNAWEWTADSFIDDWSLASFSPYEDGITDLRVPTHGQFAVVRGGSYYFDLSTNTQMERTHFVKELRRKTTGFRCAASP